MCHQTPISRSIIYWWIIPCNATILYAFQQLFEGEKISYTFYIEQILSKNKLESWDQLKHKKITSLG